MILAYNWWAGGLPVWSGVCHHPLWRLSLSMVHVVVSLLRFPPRMSYRMTCGVGWRWFPHLTSLHTGVVIHACCLFGPCQVASSQGRLVIRGCSATSGAVYLGGLGLPPAQLHLNHRCPRAEGTYLFIASVKFPSLVCCCRSCCDRCFNMRLLGVYELCARWGLFLQPPWHLRVSPVSL